MTDYQQGKIYKIINEELPNLVYYGSTTTTLKQRFTKHKSSLNCSSKVMFNVGTPEIILLEYYPCETRKELEARERVWVEDNECVNHNVPGRTHKEYCEANKEKRYEKTKQWVEDNKETINEKFDCECGGKYIHKNKARHLKCNKHKEFISLKKPFVDAIDEGLLT